MIKYICAVETNKKVALLILDGWGYGAKDQSNAILAAKTPFFNYLIENYPNATLEASGEAVGLPAGQMGNSEVGHMNLGAGRVVYQELGRIHKSIADGDFFQNPILNNAFDYAKNNGKKVHFIGLVSDGGVHSHTGHLKALCDLSQQKGLQKVYIHAFLDGRDTDPNSGIGYINDVQQHIQFSTVKIASVIGRYYAMDRDNRWERVKLAYDLMVNGIGQETENVVEAIQQSYNEEVTDEFVKPIVHVDGSGNPLAIIEENDVVICFNFRTDRGREITSALTQKAYPEQNMHPLKLRYVTMTTYDEKFE